MTSAIPTVSEVTAAIHLGVHALADHAVQIKLRRHWGATVGRQYSHRLQLLYLVIVALQSWLEHREDVNYLHDQGLGRLLWMCETLARSMQSDSL